mmetsp:Transcript_6162/g.8080  ORF Transcript_6162/g.8080 Transcript_6162/m.8080 type:complete len:226 (+) Transcript_6162:95-772(+)
MRFMRSLVRLRSLKHLPQRQYSSKAAKMDGSVHRILNYWFEPGWDRESDVSEEYFKKWFSGGEEADREIREQFQDLHDLAAKGDLAAWKSDLQGRLAYVILLDQFSRSLYRKQAKAFAFDDEAQELAKEVFESKSLQSQYKCFELKFLYMPLMHAEDKEIADMSVKAFGELAERREYMKKTQEFAQLHADIIYRFGRYPYRNDVLGRESTEEELEYMKTANTFGQ